MTSNIERIAILKPDHLGDFVLSLPAIHELLARFDADVILSTKVAQVARQLLPQARILEADFVHLGKPTSTAGGSQHDRFPNLSRYDLVVGLRLDQVLDPAWYKIYTKLYLASESGDRHESESHMLALAPLLGCYNIHDVFGRIQFQISELLDAWSTSPNVTYSPQEKCVGFSIGSGFAGNSWSPANWIKLGCKLLADGYQIKILGGSSEAAISDFIASRMTSITGGSVTVISGGNEILSFLSHVRSCRVVVASDGGTAHLCSLVAPIISLFGGSPHRKFRPLGRKNVVVTKGYACSPCIQYYSSVVNGCLGRECIDTINPDIVFDLIQDFDRFGCCDFFTDGLSIKSW